MRSKISVIIPCYNSGDFLPDAIQSIEQYTGLHEYEIIIVDDGSTDNKTLQLLADLASKNYKIIYQPNKGPAAARNTGIKNSNSEYLLFLDSDNMIFPAYVDRGIEALQSDPDVGVVYGNAEYFGEERPMLVEANLFDIQLLLASNYIDMCAVMRKSVWEQVGGFDETRELIGHEDWEFWINIYKHGWKFVHINEKLFRYRVRSGSLITETSPDTLKKKAQYVYAKHADLVYQQYQLAVTDSIIHKLDARRPIRSFFKYMRMKYLNAK